MLQKWKKNMQSTYNVFPSVILVAEASDTRVSHTFHSGLQATIFSPFLSTLSFPLFIYVFEAQSFSINLEFFAKIKGKQTEGASHTQTYTHTPHTRHLWFMWVIGFYTFIVHGYKLINIRNDKSRMLCSFSLYCETLVKEYSLIDANFLCTCISH